MSRKPHSRTITGIVLLISALPAYSSIAIADNKEVFQVSFETSCNMEVQDKFENAVTLLHSFEYVDTARIFGEIMEQDPDCAMAYWGAAMSIWHPLWAPPSAEELRRGSEILAQAPM